MSKFTAQTILFILCVVALCLLLGGCSLFRKSGQIKSGQTTVQGIENAGKPATLNSSDAHESIPIPAGSTLVVTRTAAQEASGTTAAKPAVEVTELRLNGNTEWQRFDTKTVASTGTVDTTVAEKKLEVQAAQPLLYAAILSALAGIFFVWRAYPTPAALCGLSAALFFVAWRTSSLPSWVWGLAGLGVVGGAALYIGHNRGLYEPVPTTPTKVT